MIKFPDSYSGMRLWRYMSFGRFVWMLQERALWLSRADLLGDQWETALSTLQIEMIMKRIAADIGPGERFSTSVDAVLSLAAFLGSLRRSVYANCWTRGDSESHAMWRIYCRSTEGVAVQTTFGRLRASLPEHLEVLPVGYEHGSDDELGILAVVTQKRPAFAYEHEIRVVSFDWSSIKTAPNNPLGQRVDWNPAQHIEEIRVHPESDDSFFKTVTNTVHAFAPELVGTVHTSEIAPGPETAYVPLIPHV
jgi:hypothetical protein